MENSSLVQIWNASAITSVKLNAKSDTVIYYTYATYKSNVTKPLNFILKRIQKMTKKCTEMCTTHFIENLVHR